MSLNLNFLSPRLIRSLVKLSEQNDYMTVHEMAAFLKTSKRTLFREMKDINNILKPFHLSLQSKTGLGIRLEGKVEHISQFRSILLQTSLAQTNFNKEDRQTILLAELLKNKKLEKLMVYAHQFQTSEATISHDLSAIEPVLKQYHLTLIRKPGSNMELEGTEDNVRKAILDFIYKHLEEDKFSTLINHREPWDIETYFSNQGPDSILQVLNKDILWRVITLLKENDFFWIHRLAQNAYIGLILHLSIAIERMLNQEKIVMDANLLQQLKQDHMFDKAKELSEMFEDEFNLVFPIEEIAYISMHLKGARLLYTETDEEDLQSNYSMLELQHMIFLLISEFEQVAKVNLKMDDLLVSGLLTHLRPALTRVQYKMKIRNPLLKQIQTKYQDVYQMSETAVRNMPMEDMSLLNDHEIGYIALHFGAALERLTQDKQQVHLKVAVLCASGIGISSLLASRIKRIFKDSLEIQPRSHLDLKTIEQENFDLIISTMEIAHSPLPILLVNPLLNDEDILAIQTKIASFNYGPMPKRETPSSTLSWEDRFKKIALLTSQIQSLQDNIRVRTLDECEDIDCLIHHIAQDFASSQTGISQVEDDLKKRENIGSLILKDEKIAIFHARSQGVTQAKMMLYTSSTQVFRAYKEEDIQTLLVLMVPFTISLEMNQWLSLLTAGLIEDVSYLAAIQSHQENDIQTQVKRILEEPFKLWLRKQV